MPPAPGRLALLFQHAAREDSATVELVRDLTDYLKRARKNPALRFMSTG